MRIAYCIREKYENGGDGIQAIKTKEYLVKKYNVNIDIITNPNQLDASYDLVHIFNYATTDLSKAFFNKALELKLKIVSSPIYWDYSYSIMPLYMYFWCDKNFISECFIQFHRFFHSIISLLPKSLIKESYTNVSSRFKRHIRFFVKNSELILPNSYEEGELCCSFAGINDEKSKIRVVYNGVDVSGVKILGREEFFSKYNIPQNYILQVGRVEYPKNQMNLISAMMDFPEIPIVIVGTPNEKYPYVHKLRKLAAKRGNVYFLEHVTHDEVYSFYYYAKIHVLLSMRESPGLVNLEALSQGCPIVISDERCLPVKTYFKENFISVNPFDKKKIKNAIMRAYEMEHKKVDLSEFSWEKVADQTYAAYSELLNGSSK